MEGEYIRCQFYGSCYSIAPVMAVSTMYYLF